MLTQEITIMDRAVYDMGAQAGAGWLEEKLVRGQLADIKEVLDQSLANRAKLADKIASDFGTLASAGGMVWHRYKEQAYSAGWLAGFNAALIEEIQHGTESVIVARLLAGNNPL